MTSPMPVRIARAVGAFIVLLSALVLVSAHNEAEAAGEGIAVVKTVSSNTIAYGAVSTWTLTIDTDVDIGGATGITVTDTIPDGLCPVGAGGPDCPTGTAPSPAYTSAVENADGTWTLSWDLADMGPSATAIVTYDTVARTHYQEGFADDTPILARDSWNNTAHLHADVDGAPVDDYSAASQAGPSLAISKEVASRPDPLTGPAVCGDGSALTWNSTQADGYRVGDQVCWRLSIDYPAGVVTAGTTIADALPPGHLYTAADTWAPGSGNTVPPADIDGSAIGSGVSSVAWVVGDLDGYIAPGARLEIVFSSTIGDPTASTSGQTVANSATVTHANSNGASYNSTDSARVEVLEPQLDLIKGISAVNGAATGGGNVDGLEVMQGDIVTYQITITNTGDLNANDVEVWDLLPGAFAVCSVNVASISDSGACADGPNQIEWTGASALTVPAGGSALLTYEVTIPTGLAPDEMMANTAEIRAYTAPVNKGGVFTYIPGGNTTLANDGSNVSTAIPTIGTTRTTSVDDPGNDPEWQATIGETITYTISAIVPEGTTVYSASLVDDLPLNLDLVSASHTYDGADPLTLTEDAATDTVQVTWPDPYTNATGSGDDTLVVTIVARVLDIPTNVRGTVVSNSATFTWFNQDGDRRDIHASVPTTLVEPSITIDKTSIDSFGNDGFIVGGELVDTTLTITNANQPNVATAHDVVVVDSLPEGLTPTIITDGGVWAADSTPGDGLGGTITWNLAAVSPGTPATPSYQVAVNDPVVVSSVFTNNVAATATSLAGAISGERTAGPDYSATDTVTLNSPLASITKALIPTTATIGDDLEYTIAVTIPPGTIMYDATVLDTLPPDIVFDGLTSGICTMGGGACVPDIAVEHVYNSGQEYSFLLGDLTVSGAAARTLTIVYSAHVDDTVGAGETRDNFAAILGNTTDVLGVDPGFVSGPFHVATGPATSSVSVAEPSLVIDKDVSGQVGDDDWRRARAGDFLDYTLRVSNTGSYLAPAYDVTVVDTLPAGVSDPSLISGGGVWSAGPRTLTWNIPGPLHPNTSQALSYRVFVDSALDWTDENPAAAELINTGDVTSYYGVPAAERVANGFDYITYTDVVADAVSVELDLARLGDYVWFDIDGDGAQDAAEPPLVGVDVTVTYHGPDGILGNGDDEIWARTTAADGSYLVEELPGGIYTVVVDATDVPEGMTPSYNFDATLDHTWSGSLAENGNEARIDFGYTGSGSIGDTVWFDINADGVRDGFEYGLEGVAVNVTWYGLNGIEDGDDQTYTVTTGPSGSYLVEDLPAGSYVISVIDTTLPAGMLATYDSDGLAGSLHTSSLTLGGNEDRLDQDFGYAGSASIGDIVWLDDDGDGIQGGTEPGLVGVPVQLTWPGENGVLGGGDDELFLDTTDGAGSYLFRNLPTGNYRIEILGGLPSAAANTGDPDGGGDSMATVTVGNGTAVDTMDFGYQGTASIGDTVWWDRNGNGTVDVDETGIPGIDVLLTYAGLDGVFGNGDDLAFATTTGIGGNYLFSDLPDGDYRVEIGSNVPSGFVPSFDETGPVDETSYVTGLTTAQLHLTADFGYVGTGSIGDLVWLDLSGDGGQDAGEPGIPGVDVYLIWYGPDGGEGSSDDVAISTVTGIDGAYLFGQLPAGGFDIVIDPATLPAGLSATADPDGLASPSFASLLLGAGSDELGQDFGYVGGASIGDTVWFDRNEDGVVDVDEYGLPGVAVAVTWAGPDDVFGGADDELFPATTDAAGRYVVASLPGGEYRVVVDTGTIPAGMSPTDDLDHTPDNETTFTLADGATHREADFGYSGSGEIGDLVWLDRNGDGTADPDEPGLPAQAIELTWAGPDGSLGTSDDQLYGAVTDNGGSYSYGHLPPGDYEVAVAGAITSLAANSHDEDGNFDSTVTVALGEASAHTTADFGYQGSNEIGDLVWLDLDGDGLADGEEPGLAGVELAMSWHGADGVAGGSDDVNLPVAVTDDSGLYLMTGLPDGSFEVTVTTGVPPGLVVSADGDGTLDGHTEIEGLTAGSSHLTADFGYAGAGVIGDYIWWDLDGDGSADAPEPGLAGIEVALAWSGFDAAVGNADDAGWVAATDGAGAYRFEHLPPGDYSITVAEDGLPLGMVQSADPDGTFDGGSMVALEAGEEVSDQDFGYRGEGSIGDLVWYDLDADGIADPGEPGVAGVVLRATYIGAEGVAGDGDDVPFAVTTDEAGRYALPGMPSGFYSMVVDDASLPSGTVIVSDVDGGDPLSTLFTVGSAEHKTDVDYGVAGAASLLGTVWRDTDGDSVADEDEVGVPGITVTATWVDPTGSATAVTTTGPDGFWEINGLPLGTYTVALGVLPADMAATGATEASVTLSGASEAVDFGIAPLVDVGSTVWIDRNGDGVVDSDEAGIPEVLVNLYDEAGQLQGIAETDAAGNYTFSDVLPGLYRVEIDADTLPGDVLASWDRDGSPDLTTLVDLTTGLDVLDANFGFQVGLPRTGLELQRFAIWGAVMLLLGMAMAAVTVLRREDPIASEYISGADTGR